MSRLSELNSLCAKAYAEGNRRKFKLLSWRAAKLLATGIEPTHDDALAAFGYKPSKGLKE